MFICKKSDAHDEKNISIVASFLGFIFFIISFSY